MFISPMLCTTLRDSQRVGDPRYVAEPKFDGQRPRSTSRKAVLYAAYSRPGRSLLPYPGLACLREVAGPSTKRCSTVSRARAGMEGILGGFEVWERRGTPSPFRPSKSSKSTGTTLWPSRGVTVASGLKMSERSWRCRTSPSCL
jgi:hypothetical protein